LDNNDVLPVPVNIELFTEQFIVLRRNAGCVCHVRSNPLKGNQRGKIVLEHYEAAKILNEVKHTNIYYSMTLHSIE
jgi:hypothetical protein